MKWLLVGGLALSAGVTALLWVLGIPGFFLFLPFIFAPFLFGSRTTRRCPACGWSTPRQDEHYCPRDGTRLA